MAARVLVTALCCAAALLPAAAPAHPGHGATSVVVRDTTLGGRYHPATVTVVVGDDVIWTWSGQVRNHSVTAHAGQAESFDSDPGKSSGEIAQPADRAFTHRFDEVGTFGYFCKVHPEMHGEVEVIPVDGIADTVRPRIRSARVLAKRGRLRLRISERADVLARLIRGRTTLRVFDFSVRRGLNRRPAPTKSLEPGRYKLRLVAFDLADNASRTIVERFRVR